MKVYVLFREGERDSHDTEILDVFASRGLAERVRAQLVDLPRERHEWSGAWLDWELEIEEYEVRGE